MGRILVMGDIHGAHKALLQCLERSEFKEDDTLIQLGDVVDGWSESFECVEELLKIKNLISIRGNHDSWFNHWLTIGEHPVFWLHGGDKTLKSYCDNCDSKYTHTGQGYMTSLCSAVIPETHKEFFKNQKLYYKDHKNNIFVHGGFQRMAYLDYLEKFYPSDFYWDRDLWKQAMRASRGLKYAEDINEVFIGHTATVNWLNNKNEPITEPMHHSNVWNIDTGAGWFGKLTIMDVNTKEFWQSDRSQDLYPNELGRK